MAITVAVVAVPRSARACTFPVRPLEEYSEEVAVAFFGREIDRREEGQQAVLTFEVDRVYKGEVGPRISFDVSGPEGPCSHFIPGGVTTVLAWMADEDTQWGTAGDLYIMLESSFVSEADLERVFGAGYPPDETLLIAEEVSPPAHTGPEPPGNPTTTRQTVAVGIALAVLCAGLIAIHRRRRREGL